MNNIEVGKLGEDVVAYYLEKNGCCIVNKNYRTKDGEIDIIYIDGSCLVFGEVKARNSLIYGRPCESVNKKKQIQIINLAKKFIYKYGFKNDSVNIRFDIFEVYIKEKKIRHLKNAYTL